MAKVTMPQLGESVAEGTIGKWLKQPGDHVAKYEPLVEVVTDKVNAEVPSPFEGVLREILAEEGAVVPNNAEIAVIETADDGATDAAASAPPAAPAAAAARPETAAATTPPPAPAATRPAAPVPTPAVAAGPAGSDERGPTEMAAAAHAPAVAAPANADPDARMTPAVRRLLREHDLTAAQIQGTGGGGRITRDDVLRVVEQIRTGAPTPAVAGRGNGSAGPATAPAGPPASPKTAPTLPAGAAIEFPAGTDEVLVPMTQMRKGIAAQMARALAVPHAYVQMEVDVTSLVRFRDRNKRDYQAREGMSLSFVPFVVKASAEALKRNLTFNAHWTDAGLLAKRRINIGIAVAVEDGLIVPVLRDVDSLSISGLNKAIADVSERTRAGKLRVDDFGGG